MVYMEQFHNSLIVGLEARHHLRLFAPENDVLMYSTKKYFVEILVTLRHDNTNTSVSH
jgi:hypothetical protein